MVRKIIRQNKSLIGALHISIATGSWAWVCYILFFIHPSQWKDMYYLPFLTSVFTAAFITTRVFSRKWIVCLLIPLGLVSIISVRIFLMKDIFNPILISGLVATLIYFFTSGSSNAILTPKTSLIGKSTPQQTDNYASLTQTDRPESGTRN